MSSVVVAFEPGAATGASADGLAAAMSVAAAVVLVAAAALVLIPEGGRHAGS